MKSLHYYPIRVAVVSLSGAHLKFPASNVSRYLRYITKRARIEVIVPHGCTRTPKTVLRMNDSDKNAQINDLCDSFKFQHSSNRKEIIK